MEIDDQFQKLNETSYLSDEEQNIDNLIDISESEIFYRNKTKKSNRVQEKPNYNSFKLSSKATNRFVGNPYRTISASSEESIFETVLESTENDSLLHSEELLNRNKIQLNPIRE